MRYGNLFILEIQKAKQNGNQFQTLKFLLKKTFDKFLFFDILFCVQSRTKPNQTTKIEIPDNENTNAQPYNIVQHCIIYSNRTNQRTLETSLFSEKVKCLAKKFEELECKVWDMEDSILNQKNKTK